LGGADVLRGGSGNDDLCGQTGNDHLFGEAGADFLDGGGDTDTCDLPMWRSPSRRSFAQKAMRRSDS
jgi:hypothetical protein